MRAQFQEPVVAYMSRDLEVARPDTSLALLARAMHSRAISGLPIVDSARGLVGVVTRTDLIKVGLRQAGHRPSNRVMPLPHARACDVMTRDPEHMSAAGFVRHAAERMISREIHRVFVTENGTLVGVICAVDLAGVVAETRIDVPASSVMTTPIVTIDVRDPVAAAVDLLDQLHVLAVVVTDEGQPIGMFSQIDAMATRDLARDTPLDAVYDGSIISVPAEMKLHRVAAQMAWLHARRVVVCRAGAIVGIISAMDLARVVAVS